MANVAITQECRRKLAYIQDPDEFLRDTIERLVNEQVTRKGITIPTK